MELHEHDGYAQLLSHIDDLKQVCEKLKIDLNLLEIPIQQANSRVIPLMKALFASSDCSSMSSSLSSLDSSEDLDG